MFCQKHMFCILVQVSFIFLTHPPTHGPRSAGPTYPPAGGGGGVSTLSRPRCGNADRYGQYPAWVELYMD